MAYRGNVAYQLDAYQAYEVPARRPLSVHEGGGLDARASRDASSSIVTLIKSAIVLTVMVAVLGAARVALTVQTVTLLTQVSVAEDTVARARVERAELNVERSTLTSADRIQRIATENYGMVYASEVDTIVLQQQDEGASAEDAQSADAADTASPDA